MEPITTITSRTVVLPLPNIDTDQIIPARFLTTTSRTGLGAHLFEDWRGTGGGDDPRSAFHGQENDGRSILVTGHNFGCGSSREHAVWALMDAGYRAVVSTAFADIFKANAVRNGLLPVVVDEPTHTWLVTHAGAEVTISLESCTLAVGSVLEVSFPFDRFARQCLLRGQDELSYVLSHSSEILKYEEAQR